MCRCEFASSVPTPAGFDIHSFNSSGIFLDCSCNIPFHLIGLFVDIFSRDLVQVKYLNRLGPQKTTKLALRLTRVVNRTCGTLPIWQNHVRATVLCESPLCCLLCFRPESAVLSTLWLTSSLSRTNLCPRTRVDTRTCHRTVFSSSSANFHASPGRPGERRPTASSSPASSPHS